MLLKDPIKSIESDLSTFEQLYNAACLKIECKEWKACLQYLDKAIGWYFLAEIMYNFLELCHAILTEEGLTGEELEQELAFLKVQRAYVHQQMGQTADAQDEYRKIQACNCTDVSVAATLLNNSICFDGEFNLAGIKKNLKTALSLDQSKLTVRQKRCLAQNNVRNHCYNFYLAL